VVAGAPHFTHAAGYQAGIVVRNALFALPARADYRAMPRVTYLDPEIAGVGLTEAEARDRGIFVESVTTGLDTNDRARTERATEGFAKLVLGRRGRLLGATIVSPHAGEVVGLFGLAIARKLPLSALAGTVLPYPTYSELSKRVAGDWISPKLFAPRVRGFVRFVQGWLP
jgi:pyruvate/2-oxoglutarate dehydrogenase complex dihydrolipoamide dehydrogenase (E3) component